MDNPIRDRRDYGGNQLDNNLQVRIDEMKDGKDEIDQFGKICNESLEMKIIASQVSKKRRVRNPATRPEHECSKSTLEGYETEVCDELRGNN